MILQNQLVKEQIIETINNFIEENDNDEASYKNLGDSAKAVLRWKFISLSSYLDRVKVNELGINN